MALRQGLAQNNHFLSFLTIRNWRQDPEHLLRLRTMDGAPHPCVLECILSVVGVPGSSRDNTKHPFALRSSHGEARCVFNRTYCGPRRSRGVVFLEEGGTNGIDANEMRWHDGAFR